MCDEGKQVSVLLRRCISKSQSARVSTTTIPVSWQWTHAGQEGSVKVEFNKCHFITGMSMYFMI